MSVGPSVCLFPNNNIFSGRNLWSESYDVGDVMKLKQVYEEILTKFYLKNYQSRYSQVRCRVNPLLKFCLRRKGSEERKKFRTKHRFFSLIYFDNSYLISECLANIKLFCISYFMFHNYLWLQFLLNEIKTCIRIIMILITDIGWKDTNYYNQTPSYIWTAWELFIVLWSVTKLMTSHTSR